MVQTNQMISYLNTSVNVQKQDSGKTAKSDESKKSFSEALGEEISAQEKPAGTETPKTEESQTKDTSLETQPAETLQQAAAAVIPWTMQPQIMQQTVNTAQQITTVNTDTAEVPLAAEGIAVLTNDNAAEVNLHEVNPEIILKAETEGTEDVLFAGKLQNAEGNEDLIRQNVQTVTAEERGANVLKADAEANTSQHVQQTVQTETVQQTAEPEMLSQNVQTQTAPQQTVETPQAAKPQTVDMSNMKQGVENLAKTMSQQISQGKTEFEIWLEPANLGKMAVKVAYEGGKAMLSIICMSEKTMEIVSQNAKTLGAILQQNTGTDTVVVVEETPKDYLQQQTQQQGNRQDAQQEQQKAKNNEQEAQQESFLQQLRLGLM